MDERMIYKPSMVHSMIEWSSIACLIWLVLSVLRAMTVFVFERVLILVGLSHVGQQRHLVGIVRLF